MIRGFALYGQAVVLAKIGNNLVARYQQRLFDHLMKLGVGFFSETRSAHLAAQINQNVNGIRDLLGLTITSVARDAVSLLGAGRRDALAGLDPVGDRAADRPAAGLHRQLSDAASAGASRANRWKSIRG